ETARRPFVGKHRGPFEAPARAAARHARGLVPGAIEPAPQDRARRVAHRRRVGGSASRLITGSIIGDRAASLAAARGGSQARVPRDGYSGAYRILGIPARAPRWYTFGTPWQRPGRVGGARIRHAWTHQVLRRGGGVGRDPGRGRAALQRPRRSA